MSVDSNSECVTSKYFVGEAVMDESLSDFQEAKKSCKGPRPAQKPVKPKTRKVTKRIKGQKDIRTALKGKINELVSYTKEFDNVCKNSGVDVDSEQLQLAIALSKSLQTESDNYQSSPTLSTQQRVAKIRKTLQEYGFKVPEAKITAGKKTKKYRKKYKLLTVTKEEKHQIITGKYTQLLFENLDHSKLEHNSSNDRNAEARVFSIASNIPYKSMKDDNIFYVNNLVEKSKTNGSLLRDWSKIPGRPESPKLFDSNMMNFKEIDCSQDELDTILSGPIKSVKNVFASKQIEYEKKYKDCDVPKIIIEDHEKKMPTEDRGNKFEHKVHEIGVIENKSIFQKALNVESPIKRIHDIKSPVKRLFGNQSLVSKEIEIISPTKEVIVNSKSVEKAIDVETNNKLTFVQQYRSCSPDIFDDELSSIMDNTKPIYVLSQEHKTKVFSQDNFMDLTLCANIPSQNSEKSIQLSQNVSKRSSNDFMEITECIVGSSQPIREEFEEIDLTQSPENKGATIEGDHSINRDVDNHNTDNVSLSLSFHDAEQNHPTIKDSTSQNITDEQQVTVLSNDQENTDSHGTVKENIDLTQTSNEDDKGKTIMKYNNQTPDKKELERMDLTQSSNSNDIDGLPLVDVANSQSQTSLNDTIIINKEDYIANGKVKTSIIFENEAQGQFFDLTQAQDTSIEFNPNPVMVRNIESCSHSFYEDFIHDHSETTDNSKEIEEDTDLSNEHNSYHSESKESNNIDLTQGSDTSDKKPIMVLQNILNNSGLGKKDDVSIDYDEIIIEDNICEKGSIKETENENNQNLQYDLSKSEAHNDIELNINNDIDINSSQNSEVFNISDKELDYSLHKSRHDFARDNFDFGGLSVLDNVTKLESFRKSLSEGCQSIYAANKNYSMGDSFLPEVNIKRTENKIAKSTEFETHTAEEISPIKDQEVLKCNNGIINIKTPKNSEYIIKTDNVTPMADYASMSTPQRNRELDGYGLKPFKRKRAIQILTHLYNQTHPTIQQLVEEDQPSPSKRPRKITYTQDSSPTKLMTLPRNSPSKKMAQNTNTQTLPSPTPVKSPLNKLRYETRLLVSPRRTEDLERDTDISPASSSKKTDELGRDRDIFSASSSKATEEKGVTDVCGYKVTSEVAVVSCVDCSPDDWVFQKREKAKIHSCRVPLHIAFHNYVLSRRSLREAILKYEPVNIDVIHKDLVGYGHRYDPKDLLKFLDKKCITVKTTDNNSRNNKR